MKKSLVLLLAASFIMSVAGTALAFPLDFTGDFRLQGRSLDDGITAGGAKVAGDAKASYFQLRTRLNFTGKIDDSASFYGRFSSRNKFGEGQDQIGAGTGQFDQYGVKLTAGDWNFKVGRQGVNLGQGAIISTGFDAAGIDNKFDGVVASTRSGKFDLNFIGGKTTNDSTLWVNSSASTGAWANTEVAEWYGLDAATKLDDKVTVGAAYAHRKGAASAGTNTWAVNAAVAPTSNLTISGEYARTSRDALNKAYFLSGTYSWDKNSFGVQYQKVDKFGADQINSGIGYGNYAFKGAGLSLGDSYKGLTYSFNRQMSKNASFHLIYMDLSADGAGLAGSDKEIMTGVKWNF